MNTIATVWVYLAASPLLWLTLTLIAYGLAVRLYEAVGMHPAATPLLTATALIILALLLAWRGVGPRLRETSQALLRHLPLLFVPAGVGIVRQWGVLADYWPALSVALIVSTVATIAVTAWVFDWASRRFGAMGSSS